MEWFLSTSGEIPSTSGYFDCLSWDHHMMYGYKHKQ